MANVLTDAFQTLVSSVKDLTAKVAAKPDAYFGTVKADNGTTVSVLLDGDTTATPCAKHCAAEVDDRVTVIRRGVSMVAVSRAGVDGGGGVTYSFSKYADGDIVLTGSDGSESSVTDANTTYSLSGSGNTATLTDSGGNTSTASFSIDDFKAPFIYVNQVTSGTASCGAHSTGSVSVTLTAPTGFRIAHVLSIASNGGIVPAYVEQNVSQLTGQTSKQVTVWWHNGMTWQQNCSFSVRYMCVRDGFLTPDGTCTL